MATLAEAVDAAETDWLVSADIPDSVDFLTVQSEVVQVTATFPAQYQARDGTTSDPRIRVVRAAGGTTAASHADGTTLTPLIPPSAAGGGAGTPLSFDNTIDPPTDITSLVAAGGTVIGSEATLRGKDFYAQDTDPGAVGTGSVWKDTDASPNTYWERNAADDGWDPIFDVFVSGGVGEDAFARMRAYHAGDGGAQSGPRATTEGAGDADAQPRAVSGGAMLGAGLTGAALAGSIASSDDGLASVQGQAATSGVGTASAGGSATATDAGDALVGGVATANTGVASVSSYAERQGVQAGFEASVDALGVAHLGFNAQAASMPAIPELPATPDAQDIADVLVALGLATQAP